MDIRDCAVGTEMPVLAAGPVLRHHLVEWCAAENDYYNIHYDERAAREMGLEGAPVQGTYKFALMGEAVRDWLGAAGRLVSISASYRKPDFEGASLRCGGTVVARDGADIEIDLYAENEAGARTTLGKARVRLGATRA